MIFVFLGGDEGNYGCWVREESGYGGLIDFLFYC